MSIIKNRFLFLGFSLALVVASWLAVGFFGLLPGIDLKGGAEWQIHFSSSSITLNPDLIKQTILTANPAIAITVKTMGSNTFILRLPETSEVEHSVYSVKLQELGSFEEVSFYNIGPVISRELKSQSLKALIAVLVGISLYIAWAFRKVSQPVASWKYGITTLITLFHDVSIPTGLLAILGKLKGIEIDTNFIIALLVIMGFSVHDTIVVFDRIRENLATNNTSRDFKTIIDSSIKETLSRSINTSLTLIFVLITMLIWGPTSLFYFILVILVGTIFGTYSSICVASPIVYLWRGKSD